MLLKLIHCSVPRHLRQAFSKAQGSWRMVSQSPGFLGQAGGWENGSPSSALIAAFWRDAASYHRFMAEACRSFLRKLNRAILLRVEEWPGPTSGAGAQNTVPPEDGSMLFKPQGNSRRLLKIGLLDHSSGDTPAMRQKEGPGSRAAILRHVVLEPAWLVLPSPLER
ncbi:MAG: DUF4937 domain-containing protein [Acidobacteriota bacterium]